MSGKERQKLLEQCRRLPGDPKLKLRSRVGEVLVTFYNHMLHGPPEQDEDDAEEFESDPDLSAEEEERGRVSTCRPVPLQYLYKIQGDGLEMIAKEDLFGYLPRNPGDTVELSRGKGRSDLDGNLRIMYVIILYYFPTRGEAHVDFGMSR